MGVDVLVLTTPHNRASGPDFKPASHHSIGSAGWFPWQWTRYQFLDVLIPAVWFYFLAWCIEKLIR
jgi:hypothetical protein